MVSFLHEDNTSTARLEFGFKLDSECPRRREEIEKSIAGDRIKNRDDCILYLDICNKIALGYSVGTQVDDVRAITWSSRGKNGTAVDKLDLVDFNHRA